MRPSHRKSPAAAILACLILPFVTGFDAPDSTGNYVKAAVGRGAYGVSGCHHGYDFRYDEAQLRLRNTHAAVKPADASGWAAWKPDYWTVGISGEVIENRLASLHNDSQALVRDTLPSRDFGFAGNLYVSLDWKWAGLQLGLTDYDYLEKYPEVRKRSTLPSAGLRVGTERLYLSGEFLTSDAPLLSGGGYARGGVGGRWRATRAWLGVGSGPYRGTVPGLEVSQAFGMLDVSLSGSFDPKILAPSGVGVDHQYGMMLGLEYRLPGM